MLEKTIYNHVYKQLDENIYFYKIQFGFQKGHSTNHTIVQLVD